MKNISLVLFTLLYLLIGCSKDKTVVVEKPSFLDSEFKVTYELIFSTPVTYYNSTEICKVSYLTEDSKGPIWVIEVVPNGVTKWTKSFIANTAHVKLNSYDLAIKGVSIRLSGSASTAIAKIYINDQLHTSQEYKSSPEWIVYIDFSYRPSRQY